MQSSPPAPPAAAPPEGHASRRNMVLSALVVAVVLVLAGVGLYLTYVSRPAAPANSPPYGLGIAVSPSVGNNATLFGFTASVSDAQDAPSAIQVRWDWQSDGLWDTAWSTDKTAAHVFGQAGNYTVRLEARDTGNLTANATYALEVHRSTLVYYEMSEPVTMDPSDAYDLWSFVPLQNTYDTLVGYNRDTTQIVPELATSWDVSASGLNWTFHLRQGVRFCDGNPMTATDVAASLEKVLVEGSPESGVSWILSQTLDPTDLPGSIWVRDAYTIQLNETSPSLQGKPYVAFLSTLATVEPAGIMEALWILANGGIQPGTPNPYIMRNTMGTGPYCMSSSDWIPGSQMTLRRNPLFWRGWHGTEPETVVLKFTTDPSQRLAALQSRAADIADLPLTYVPQAATTPGLVTTGNQTIQTELVAMNTRNPYMGQDPSGRLVREAFSWALDYNATIASAYGGYASLVPGPIPAGMPYFDVEHQVYTQDLPRAAQLLDQAGYPLNGSTRFGGQAFTIVADGTQLEETHAAMMWQSTLALLGVRAILVVAATTSIWDAYRSQGTYDFFVGHWVLDYLDPDDFVTPMVVSAANAGDFWNTSYSNATVDHYAVIARSELNSGMRASDYSQVVAAAIADPNMIWFCQRQFIPVHQATLEGFWFNPVTWYNFYFYGLP